MGDGPHDEHEGGDDGAFGFGEGFEGVAAVELKEREEIKEVDPCAEFGDGGEDGSAGGEVNSPGSERCAIAPERTSETDAGFFMRTGGILFEANERAEAGNEHGCGGANAVAGQHPDMAHFVDVNGEDNAEGEFPSPAAQ